jgi:hypothetical protein
MSYSKLFIDEKRHRVTPDYAIAGLQIEGGMAYFTHRPYKSPKTH